jgi:hypothetical protein
MCNPRNLHCYGENSFTFLLFHALSARDEIVDPFLTNLKQFGTGKTFGKCRLLPKSEAHGLDVWLFPNFGKRHGFGEPDAIVLVRDLCFWIEVETRIDLAKKAAAFNQSLLQLLRFHYLASAIAQGARKGNSGPQHRVIKGPTISSKREVRKAVLRKAKHRVLQQIEKRLRCAFKTRQDHYVLLTTAKMKGTGDRADRFHEQLDKALAELETGLAEKVAKWCESEHAKPPRRVNRKRFWYAYWEGHLKGKLSPENGQHGDFMRPYVPISSA